uniref:Uncharacterized protein n=1 Tax=Timema douglasi TaxID=61478 RepID=A0A7R8ZFM3_TIMDO|nr:unnamed protein product [Timema douglasi]
MWVAVIRLAETSTCHTLLIYVHPHDPLQSRELLFLQVLEETHFGFSYGTSNPIQADTGNNLNIRSTEMQPVTLFVSSHGLLLFCLPSHILLQYEHNSLTHTSQLGAISQHQRSHEATVVNTPLAVVVITPNYEHRGSGFNSRLPSAVSRELSVNTKEAMGLLYITTS